MAYCRLESTYNALETSVKGKERSQTHMAHAEQKISCFLDVFALAETRHLVEADITKCSKDLQVSTDHLNIKYAVVPSKDVCDTSLAHWNVGEYDGFSEKYIKPTAQCCIDSVKAGTGTGTCSSIRWISSTGTVDGNHACLHEMAFYDANGKAITQTGVPACTDSGGKKPCVSQGPSKVLDWGGAWSAPWAFDGVWKKGQSGQKGFCTNSNEDHGVGWLQYDFEKPVTPTKYEVDWYPSGHCSEDTPWYFSCSQDGQTWKTIFQSPDNGCVRPQGSHETGDIK